MLNEKAVEVHLSHPDQRPNELELGVRRALIWYSVQRLADLRGWSQNWRNQKKPSLRKFCLFGFDVGIKFPTDNQGFHTSIERSTEHELLSLESPVESDLTDVVWMELGGRNTSGLQAKNVLNPPEGSSTAKGLMAWLRLRDLVQDDQNRHGDFKKRSQREMGATILNGRFDEERIIGSGQSIAWSPKVESPEIGIVALARNQNGLWGIVKRSVAVIDLRPAVLPQRS